MKIKESEKKNKFEFLEHTADIKFQTFGKSLEEVFSNSVLALFAAMYDGEIQKKYIHQIKVRGKDLENLLYNFLEEFIFLFDSKGVFVSKVETIKFDLNLMEIDCVFSGDLAKNYKLNTAVKAVTYNEMVIQESDGKWLIQVVLDI